MDTKEITEKQKLAKTIKLYSYGFLLLVVVFVVVTNCFVRVTVRGDSMLPTYHDSQMIWASKWKKPKVGDVVILKNPHFGVNDVEPEIVLKRIAGVGGDKFYFDENYNLIKETSSGTQIVQENVAVSQVLSIFGHSISSSEKKVFIAFRDIYTVPEGCVFVLGDNYDISEDSRYYGGVNKNDIIGVIYD